MPDRPATDTGSTGTGGKAGLRGAPGDRIAGDPSSHHRTPPAPACVPVVWDPDPGILARRGPHRIVRSPGAGNRRHAWWAVPPELPGNLRGHGAGVRGADQRRQRRRPLPGNRGSPRPGDRGAGGDPSHGTPAPCGRDALAPRWTQLVAVDGQECPGHGLRPLTQSWWPGDPGADLGGLPRGGHQRPLRGLQLAGPGVAYAAVLGTSRPELRGSRHPWWRRHPHRGVGPEPDPLPLR